MDFLYYLKTNKIIILTTSIIINILCIFMIIYLLIIKNDNNCNNIDNNINNDVFVTDNNSDDFYVEIKGAVKKPGVYKFNSNNIINDLIDASGGLNKNAYTKNINLSKSLSKELVVYIYTKDEYKKNQKSNVVYVTKELPCECSTYDISNCTDNLKSEIVSSDKDSVYTTTTNEEKTSLININTASIEELQMLSGIGLSKAQDIVEYRNNNGLFKEIKDITNVTGIGTSIYEKIKDSITV